MTLHKAKPLDCTLETPENGLWRSCFIEAIETLSWTVSTYHGFDRDIDREAIKTPATVRLWFGFKFVFVQLCPIYRSIIKSPSREPLYRHFPDSSAAYQLGSLSTYPLALSRRHIWPMGDDLLNYFFSSYRFRLVHWRK